MMNFDEIKDIIKKSGGKFIIVENGNPEMVITSFEDFKNSLGKTENQPPKTSERNFNKEMITPISAPTEKPRLPRELEEEPLKIEDLPF